jgi:hypothetical protein
VSSAEDLNLPENSQVKAETRLHARPRAFILKRLVRRLWRRYLCIVVNKQVRETGAEQERVG